MNAVEVLKISKYSVIIMTIVVNRIFLLLVFSVLWKSLQEDNRLAPTAYK